MAYRYLWFCLQERQKSSLCLKHTLNNLLQGPHFKKRDLDRIAASLSPGRPWPFNSHMSFFGGNYDVNVMSAALQRLGKEPHWHDERDVGYQSLDPSACWAVILNTASSTSGFSTLANPVSSGRHYVGLKKLHGHWWHFDSKAPFPVQVTISSSPTAEAEELRDFLRSLRAQDKSLHVFAVTDN